MLSAPTPPRFGLIVTLLLAFATGLPAQMQTQPQPRPRPLLLTTAAAVHELPAELAPHARVRLIGTVTYYDPLEHTLFLADDTGGVYIDTDKAYPIGPGDRILVEGNADPSYRTGVALDPAIHRLSAGKKYLAPRTTYAVLSTGSMDSKLVTLRGTVRTVDVEPHQNVPILHMDVNAPGGNIEVYQPISVVDGATVSRYVGLNKTSLLDAVVDIEGVAGGAFDTKNQLTGVILYAQTSSSIRVVKPPPVNTLDLPLTGIDEVFQSRQFVDTSRRVRLRGTLTYYKKGDSAVLEDGGRSVFVQTRETKGIPIGNVVDALGFASDQEYAPSLRQAELFDTGNQQAIVPHPITFDDAIGGAYSDNLISLTGTLVSQLHGRGMETLVLRVGDHLVTGRLEGAQELRNFRIGARLRMTGVCRIVPGGPWRAPSFFHLEMRSPADAEMLSAPSWWTVGHLFGLLGALCVLALVIAGWAVLLRRRVKQQTERIERSMLIAKRRSRLSEMISTNELLRTTLDETCRFATELLPGAECRYLLAPEPAPDLQRSKAQAAEQGRSLYARELNGEDTVAGHLLVSVPTSNAPGSRQEVFAMLSEMASLAVRQSQLHQGLLHHSTHDPLTDLPNRRLCEDRLRLALAEASQRRTQVTVLYIDINRFKHVNDRFGHKVGDLYLKAISSRLREGIRGGDTLARIGGDEFLVIAPQIVGGEAITGLSQRLQGCFDEPFFLDGHSIDGSASFGLATYPEHGTTSEDLKRYADHAMYLAKRSTAAEPASAGAPVAILTPEELEVALERDQFRLAYQPQFGSDGSMRGIEALLRLEDSILGTLTPDAFISVAERSDIILKLGRWVLERAVEDAVQWQLHTGPPVLLVVNVAMRQVIQPEFAGMVLAVLERRAFPPERLELELTERTLIAESDEIRRQLDRVRAAGVRVSLDDFGTGQSSLSMLHRLPIDTIKVDRSFISAMDVEPNVLPVIEAIAYMAQRLGKRIVAEGVEHTGPVPALLRLGEMDFQGYLLSRPVLAEDVGAVLDEWKAGLIMEPEFQTRRKGDRLR